MENVKFNKYPEALKILAEKLDLPVPKEDVAAREAYVKELIINFVMSGLY